MPEAVQVACCPLCGPGADARVKYAERLPKTDVDFAARRTPARIHFRIMQCRRCSLVFSSPVYPAEEIIGLYRQSRYIREPQLHNMLKDYVRQLRGIFGMLPDRGRLLEIGCGDGFFLRAARDTGFREVVGVEPGRQAVAQAGADIRPAILNDIFRPESFQPASFDCVCFFQVLDHIVDPVELLSGVRDVLRPGGVILAVNHNIRSWFARLLGERCPMYDIEHLCLFSPKTVRLLFDRCGFQTRAAHGIANSYTLDYAVKMMPLPGVLLRLLGGGLRTFGLAGRSVPFAAGNMVAVAVKPPI